ncbi:hypothetical protein H7R52_15120 [Weissella confusa]|uniref:Nucleotidyl transferase domain-containing protein n=1 Tax=Weissella confusa TaxID=1583 RepID=A0A923NGB5_WEICO|nr:hypothetical protein [Weissella confusa]
MYVAQEAQIHDSLMVDAVYVAGRVSHSQKPANPKSNLASMGIYVFNWKKLREYLVEGYEQGEDMVDFGKNVIPAYLANDEKVYAFAFRNYWRDVDRQDPEYVMILSGDHIYKMDYTDMIDAHKETGADLTVSVMPVPMDEASRFGIMNTDNDNKIVEFEENSNVTSVGVITQYEPYELNQHIGNGSDWGLNVMDGGVSILQPYSDGEGNKFFEGTAHAIYQNIGYSCLQLGH